MSSLPLSNYFRHLEVLSNKKQVMLVNLEVLLRWVNKTGLAPGTRRASKAQVLKIQSQINTINRELYMKKKPTVNSIKDCVTLNDIILDPVKRIQEGIPCDMLYQIPMQRTYKSNLAQHLFLKIKQEQEDKK